MLEMVIYVNKYDIVFVDIDDTLNPSNGQVSEYTKEVLKKVKDKGIKIVVNTGRSAKYAIEKSIEAGLSEYTISSNGAEVYNYHERKEIFSKPINNQDIIKIYDYCTTHNMTIILNSLEKRYINIKDYKYNSEPAIYFEDLNEVLKENKINQLVILSSNFDRMLVLPNLFKEKFPSLKVVHSSIGLIEEKREKGKEYFHDLVLENTAKSTGIVELLDYLGIDRESAARYSFLLSTPIVFAATIFKLGDFVFNTAFFAGVFASLLAKTTLQLLLVFANLFATSNNNKTLK